MNGQQSCKGTPGLGSFFGLSRLPRLARRPGLSISSGQRVGMGKEFVVGDSREARDAELDESFGLHGQRDGGGTGGAGNIWMNCRGHVL